MDNAVWVGVISALSALAGGGLAQWGAMRAARIQAETTERREAHQWERQKSDKQAAARAAKGEEFLGWVLLAEGRMLDRLVHRPSAHLKDSNWRNRKFSYIFANVKQLDADAALRAQLLARYGSESMKDLDDGELEAVYRLVAGWKKAGHAPGQAKA